MTIHREGTVTILLVLVLLLAINILSFFTLNILLAYLVLLITVAFFVFIVLFFRKPSRIVEVKDNCIVAPADGKVVVIEKTIENEYFNDKRIQVSIFMSPLNVHINWYPMSGLVKYYRYHPGSKMVAWHPKASQLNERTTIVLENEKRLQILVRQIAGAVARRIVCYSNENDFAKQGNEFGFIKFGSRVDLFLPLDASIVVELNEKVIGNKTVIARFE